MKKIIIFIYLVLFTSVNAAGHLSDKDKKKELPLFSIILIVFPF